MPTNTSGGTTTSFMNTPQATDNSYVAGEDAIYTFDVMADDLGGNAKVLWSIDDVNLNGTTTTSADGTTVATTSGDSVIDLTVKDAAGCVEKSQLGANIWIENGKVKYDSGPLDWLAAGQTAVDYFTYAIRLSNGTLSWATVQVTLTGTNDAPTISAADAAGAVTEDAAVVDGKLSDAGTITFDDVDLTDTHSVSQVTAAGTNALGGTLTASVTDAAAGVGGGTVTWNYSVANSAVQYLAQGQTATETFTVRIADISGGYVEQVIVVTVTGTNDAPAILVQDLTGAVVEDASSPNLADSGTLTFDDIDLTDTHSTSVIAVAGNTLGGTLTATITDSATGAGDGTVTWNYSVANSATQYLAEGQTASESFTVRITDNNGGYVERVVVVTVTGTNDLPTVTAADLVGALVEDESDPDLIDSGVLTFDDVDLTDTHTTSVTASADNELGGTLNASVSDSATGPGEGTVTWSYSVANGAVQNLAEGETASETFTVRIEDNHGGYVDREVVVTVTGTNDRPVANADSSTTSENASVTVDVLANDTDVDNGAVLTVTAASAPSGQGSASVDGNQVQFDPGTDFDGLAEGETVDVLVSYTIADEHGATSSSSVTITVTGTNDGPVANADTGSTTENAAVTINVLANDTDADNGAVLTVAGAPAPAGQGLASVVANQVQFDPGSDFDHLAAGDAASVTVSYTIEDEHGATSSSTVTITVTGTNDGPVANADTDATAENAILLVDVLANDTDADDGAILTVVEASVPSGQGSASIVGNQVQFDPGTDFDHLAEGDTASVTLSYTIEDEHGASSSSTVTITVTGTNDGPVANADLAGTSENATVTVDVLANDTDVDDGATLTVTTASAPAGQGLASVDGNQVRFDPGTDFDTLAVGESAEVVVSYTIEDEHGASSSSSVTITVTGTNDGPLANADLAETSQNGALTVDVVANDTDVDNGAVLTVTAASAPAGQGSATIVGNQVRFDPGTDFDSLAVGQTTEVVVSYTIEDEHGASSSSSVAVTVTGTNDGPVANLDMGATFENATVLIDVLANDTDVDDGAVLTVTGTSVPAGQGSASVVGNQVQFDPGSDFDHLAEGDTASVTLSYTIEDEHGASSSSTVAITVTGTNDGPVATADVADTSENAAITVNVLANDTDIDDGAVLTVTAASAPSGQGSASVVGNQVQFDPGTDFDGLAEGETVDVLVSYTIADEHGATSSSSVTITVTGTNDGPVANADTGSTTENAAVTIDILANDTDADNGAVLTVTGASAPVGQGLASVVANQVHFDPGTDFDHLAEGESAEVVISYAIEDEHGAVAHSTLTVTVTGTNDGPVANPDTAATDENGPVLVDVVANDTDADDGAVFTITAASAPAGQGTASVDANQVAFDPGTDFDYLGVGETASVEVSYTIEDEHGATSSSTVSITVTGTNDTPIANAASESVAEDGLFSGSVTATDADGDTVSFSLLDPAPEGLTFNDDGTYSIDAASYDWLYQGQTATYLLAFTATDTNGTTSAPAILSITITGTNDVPVVEAAILDQSVPEDTLWTFTVPAGTFADPDSVLLYSATLGDGSDLPSWLSFDPDTQTFNGTPPVEFSGTISLKVTATDGLATASDTFDLTVTAVNDAPVNTLPATFSTNEDTALALNGLQVTDADAGSGTISVQLSVDGGWLTAASAGGVTVTGSGTASLTLSGTLAALNAYLAAAASQPVFNPTGNASGPVNLTMTTNDGGNSGGSAVADTDTSVITVVAVNDAPVNSVPGTQSVQAGVATDIDTFGAWVSDIDSPTLTSTVSVGHGTLSVATGTGATVAGDGSGTVTLSGTQAQINAALDALRYTSASGFSGTDTLTLATTDGALTDTDQVSIQVNGAQAVNIKFVPNGNDYGNTLPSGEVFGTFVAYDANGNVIPGATITSSIVAGGDLSFNNGQLAGDLGNGDVFTFTVTSGSVTETVTIRVGNGTGNAFTGNANIDIMFGVNGSDPLSGGDNDDALYGNDAGDTLNGGENDDFLIGGDAGDTLNGGNGNDYLRGGLGVDTLTGGAGNDLFVFNVTPGTANRDMITDFNASGDPLNGDRILLEDGIFSAFGSTFDAGEFRASVGGTALDGNDFLLFDTSTGNLYYDADGNGAGARQLIAVVTVTSGTIDPADFLLV